jgi:hypothetical protein
MPEALRNFFEDQLVFNGVNAVTGDYGLPPLSSQRLARLIRGAPSPEDYREFVRAQKRVAGLSQIDDRLTRVTEEQLREQEADDSVRLEELKFKARSQAPWPVKPGAGDLARVEDVGWGAIFPAQMNPALSAAIMEALQPLFDHRQSQAGDLFCIYTGGLAYRRGERKDQYFQRLRVGPGLADPQEMPFYLMLVGTPDEIPYSFQYQLDVMRGVGRLDFGGDVEAYHAYALQVVAAESGAVTLPRRAAFFAPVNPGDRATELSGNYLVQPLYENLCVSAPEYEVELTHPWELVPPLLGEGQATHDQLGRLLGRDASQQPALLFTASHGVEFPPDHPAQLRHQGALLCQDWAGPGDDVQRAHYFTSDDVASSADLSGMMAFFFACHGAGTPELDQFAAQAFKVRERIASRNFTAALPQRLLKQGALAVLGHVERAWGYSFISPRGAIENQTFVTAMRLLMNGKPVGMATDSSFNMKYAELSSDLSADLDELKWDPDYMSAFELAHRWTANNDARSYVVIGDPAARLPLEPDRPAPREQPDLGTIELPEAELEPETDVDVDGEVEASASALISEPPAAQERVVSIDLAHEPAVVAFGLGDQFANLRNSLRDFTGQLATSLGKAAEEIVTLDIRTYTTSDLEALAQALDTRTEIDATLRALTRVAFDGDIQIYVPEKLDGGKEQALWMIHKSMVQEAQESRARFLATMAELATRLLDSLKIGP